MELLRKIDKIVISILFLFFLTGCTVSEKQDKFVLLFTSDYIYNNDKSFLTSYQNDGIENSMISVDGALHYNIIEIEGDLFVNNGNLESRITSTKKSESKEYSSFQGYLEMGRYTVYNDEVIYLFNYGLNSEGSYESRVSNQQLATLKISGYIWSYKRDKNKLFIISGDPDGSRNSKYNFLTIDLDTFEVLSKTDLNIEKLSAIHDIKNSEQGTNMEVFVETFCEDCSGGIKTWIMSVDEKSGDIEKMISVEEIVTDNKIIYTTLTRYNDDFFFINTKGELIKIYNDSSRFSYEATGVSVPDFFGGFLLIYQRDDRLYVLETGDDLYVAEINMVDMSINESIKLSRNKHTKNLFVYSFIVRN